GEIFRAGRPGNGNPRIGIELFVARIGRELAWRVVLGMWRLEADRQTERFRAVTPLQKLQRLVTHLVREMNRIAFLKEAALAGEAAPVIKFLVRHDPADAVFADKAGAVTRRAEQPRIRLRESRRRKRGFEVVDAVAPGVLAREDAGPADAANGSGD